MSDFMRNFNVNAFIIKIQYTVRSIGKYSEKDNEAIN